MKRRKTIRTIMGWVIVATATARPPMAAAQADEKTAANVLEEFRVKREENFEFAKKPGVQRDGDTIRIAFETRGYPDATVAIEDGDGRILRHLASGVLGANAPEPFAKNSKAQTLIWDGKDDQGVYVDNKDAVVVRVSLGIHFRFERQALWTPYRRISNQGAFPTLNAPAPFAAQPEGVYVFDGCQLDHLRLFDHDGNYVRTVYPFAADKIDNVQGLATHVFPQTGRKLPLKGGNYHSTLLTSGTNREGGELDQLYGMAATAMAIRKGRIALACNRLNLLLADGGPADRPLTGPETKIANMLPRSAALSPDGKTLYITGWNRDGWRPNWRNVWVHGVAKIDMETGKKMETFAGVLSPDPKIGGSGNGQFKSPVSIDTDPQGRVYVADRFNERIQIFDAQGQHLKNIAIPGGAVSRPSEVAVDQVTGDIHVFSWYMDCHAFRKESQHKRVAKMFHFGPFAKPALKGEYALPIADQSRRGRYGGDQLQGREFRAAIDSWSGDKGGARIWLIQSHPEAPRVYRMNTEKKTLELVKNFQAQAAADLPSSVWDYGDKRLSVRPTTGELYIMHGSQPTVLDPESGRMRNVKLPLAATGLNFDINGHAYLRASRSHIARFNIDSAERWSEVPFDYGEAIGGRIAAMPLNSSSLHLSYVLSVSPLGHLVAGYMIGKPQTRGRADRQDDKGWKPWTPQIYEGRGGNSIVRVWDKHGKMLYEDAVPGIGYLHSAYMDRDHNIYVASEAARNGYFDYMSGTVARVRPGGRILSTEAIVPIKTTPQRPQDTLRGAGHRGASWWEDADAWFYGGIGYSGKNNSTCHCPNFQMAHDYFARTFAPETRHFSVALLDKAGNLVTRLGRYGNIDEGMPLIVSGPPVPNRRSIGGDELAFFHPKFVATHTDRRVFVHDPGNQRTVSVKIGYHTRETVALENVPDQALSAKQ